ncbi:hypothetical protein C0J52_15675 [Blattella germanica]|nr:hypothetical protein C0J52_15675 [Blattella germanica]
MTNVIEDDSTERLVVHLVCSVLLTSAKESSSAFCFLSMPTMVQQTDAGKGLSCGSRNKVPCAYVALANVVWECQIGRMMNLHSVLAAMYQEIGDMQMAVSIHVAVTPRSSKSLSSPRLAVIFLMFVTFCQEERKICHVFENVRLITGLIQWMI